MAQKIAAGMPGDMDLVAQYVIEFAALNPTTGAAVAGVKVSNAQLLVMPVDVDDVVNLESGPFMLVPGPQA